MLILQQKFFSFKLDYHEKNIRKLFERKEKTVNIFFINITYFYL